jgi:hypothetical protein
MNDGVGEVLRLVGDSDVLEVASFMQKRFSADRLTVIAKGVAALALLLWRKLPAEDIAVLRLEWPSPT